MGDSSKHYTDTPVSRGGEKKVLQRKTSRRLFSQDQEARGAPALNADMPSEHPLGARPKTNRKAKTKAQLGGKINLPAAHRDERPRKALTRWETRDLGNLHRMVELEDQEMEVLGLYDR